MWRWELKLVPTDVAVASETEGKLAAASRQLESIRSHRVAVLEAHARDLESGERQIAELEKERQANLDGVSVSLIVLFLILEMSELQRQLEEESRLLELAQEQFERECAAMITKVRTANFHDFLSRLSP